MVTFEVPEVTELEAVNVSVLAPPVMGFAANVAVCKRRLKSAAGSCV